MLRARESPRLFRSPSLPPSSFMHGANWPRTKPSDRCITDASLRIRRLNFSTRPRNSLPSPPPRRLGIYIDEYDACLDSRVNLSLSLSLSLRFFFPLNGHRNFFPSRVEQVPFILPPAHLSTCRKGEAFRSDGGRGGEKKCRSV